MLILPIQSILEVEAPIFGSLIYDLSRLKKSNLPVLNGVAISPPEFVAKTIISHLQNNRLEIFEQKLILIRKDILNNPIPEELVQLLKSDKFFYFNHQFYQKKQELWHELLESWLQQIRSNIYRDGFSTSINEQLQSEVVFFTTKKSPVISASYNLKLSDVIVHSSDKIDHDDFLQIKKFVTNAQISLVQDYCYHFQVLPELKLIGLTHNTAVEYPSVSNELHLDTATEVEIIKSATKIYVANPVGLTVHDQHIDGVVIESEKFETNDKLLSFIIDMTSQKLNLPLIYKLPDIKTTDVQGSLRLLNQKSLFITHINNFLFLLHKQRAINLQICIPTVRSQDEYFQIKQQILEAGIKENRVKFWLEFSKPENLINFDAYLKIGLDGIILDLDGVHIGLGGYNTIEVHNYSHQISALLKFSQPFIDLISKQRVPILAKGETISNPEILDFLIDQEVYGIVVGNLVTTLGLNQHLSSRESSSLIRKITNQSVN